jgi:hypothetical protein
VYIMSVEGSTRATQMESTSDTQSMFLSEGWKYLMGMHGTYTVSVKRWRISLYGVGTKIEESSDGVFPVKMMFVVDERGFCPGMQEEIVIAFWQCLWKCFWCRSSARQQGDTSRKVASTRAMKIVCTFCNLAQGSMLLCFCVFAGTGVQ